MGHRLTKIYTRTGDKSQTGLVDGTRIAKDSLRVEVIGDVDELNSHIGVVMSHAIPEPVAACLEDIQHDLFHIGGELAAPGRESITAEDVSALEKILDGLLGEPNRQHAVFEAVVVEDIRERGGNERLDSVIRQGPHGMLAT